MYAETLNQTNKAEARRAKWSHPGYAPHCFEQPCVHRSIREGVKASLRYRNAIQHIQQWGFLSILPIYEREKGVDFCRSAIKSEIGTHRQGISCSNGTRITSKQSELVWHHVVGIRRLKWTGNKFERLASWGLSTMAKNLVIKKCSSPYGGLKDTFISPRGGLMQVLISPWRGPIRGCFCVSLSPCCGHLLVIPLYMLNSEWSWGE